MPRALKAEYVRTIMRPSCYPCRLKRRIMTDYDDRTEVDIENEIAKEWLHNAWNWICVTATVLTVAFLILGGGYLLMCSLEWMK